VLPSSAQLLVLKAEVTRIVAQTRPNARTLERSMNTHDCTHEHSYTYVNKDLSILLIVHATIKTLELWTKISK